MKLSNGDRLRLADSADFLAFYGRLPFYRVAAEAAVGVGGTLLGIGGHAFHPEGAMAFLDLAPDLDVERHKRTLLTAVRRTLDRARRTGRPVFVLRDVMQPKSRGFLRHFGFRPADDAATANIWILDPTALEICE